MRRGNHARNGRDQCFFAAEAATDGRHAIGQAEHLTLCGFHFLARHRVRQLAQTCQTLFSKRFGSAKFGQLSQLAGPLQGGERRDDVGQDLSLLDGLPCAGQAIRAGFDASGVDGLDFAPSVGVHQHPTIEFKGAWQLSGFHHHRAHIQLALGWFGQKHAAIGHALWTIGIGRRRRSAVVMAFARVRRQRSTCKGQSSGQCHPVTFF